MAGKHKVAVSPQHVLKSLKSTLRTFSVNMATRSTTWSFDVSSFMVLVGEAEEFNYRLMHRSLLECLSAAPVAGLQSYIRSNYALLEATGCSYFSPHGCKTAPLRNMRLARSISNLKMLRDGTCHVYQAPATWRRKGPVIRSIIATASTWFIFAGILIFIALMESTTWIGYSACIGLTAWSIILRLAERYCIKKASVKASHPDQLDSVYILGRRNSCFVLQGSREDVLKWTGQGLQQQEGLVEDIICLGTRVGSLAVLIYILILIPNGTTWDQVAFIMLNTMGQLNVMLGQKLNAKACLAELELIGKEATPTRTHVYASLLRRFGNGDWVDKAGLLPQTDVWMAWRHAVASNTSIDPKQLYEMCAVNRTVNDKPPEEDTILEGKDASLVDSDEVVVKEIEEFQTKA